MFSILKSAFNYVLGWIFRISIVKFLVMGFLSIVTGSLLSYVISKLDTSPVSGLQTALNGIPSGILYFLGLFKVDVGIPLIFGAMLTKFLIRRLPIIG